MLKLTTRNPTSDYQGTCSNLFGHKAMVGLYTQAFERKKEKLAFIKKTKGSSIKDVGIF